MSQSNLAGEAETKLYAGFWSRAGAAAIDAAGIAIVGISCQIAVDVILAILRGLSPLMPLSCDWSVILLYGLASFLDGLFVLVHPTLIIVNAYILYMGGDIMGLDYLLDTHATWFLLIFSVGVCLGNWLYHSLMESSSKHSTFGKLALKIEVTDLSGNRVSFLRATSRHFSKIISGMILLIGFIMAALTDKRQGLHDKIAGCLVVKHVLRHRGN